MRSGALSCLVAAVFATAPSRPRQHEELSHSKETIWFALQANPSGGFVIEPIARVTDGKLIPVPNGCRDKNPKYEEFRKIYAIPNRSYSVFFRGSPAGKVSLLKAAGNLAPYPVKYEGLTPLGGQTEALATNATGRRSTSPLRHSPTATERNAAIHIAKRLFAQAGVAPKLLTGLKVENLTRTILVPSKQPSLIGSFSVSADGNESGIVHNLFFIATAGRNGYVTELSWAQISRGETDNENLQLSIKRTCLVMEGTK
ncbi:MAG: hypothetical protein WBB89_00635 [Candidatus Acidiferrum sp.]